MRENLIPKASRSTALAENEMEGSRKWKMVLRLMEVISSWPEAAGGFTPGQPNTKQKAGKVFSALEGCDQEVRPPTHIHEYLKSNA